MAQIWTGESLRKLFGDVDDGQLAAILALNPSLAEVEMALAWLNRAGMEPAEGWPVEGKAVDIVDILSADEDEEP